MRDAQRQTHAAILTLRTPNGGYTRADLARLGVTWPPLKGWLRRLLKGEDPNVPARSVPKS